MPETMLERVAKAIIESDNAEPLFACACSGKANPDDLACPCKLRAADRRARAAIEAMRTMTPEMRGALILYGMLDGDPDEAWDQTISAALTQQGEGK